MIFLLDANVLINANRDYYAIDQVPEYWEWLLHVALQDKVKIPIEIYEELLQGRKDDPLYIWAKENRKTLLFERKLDIALVGKIINEGYASDLTDDEIDNLGRDPFIIAYAKTEKTCCIVTAEVSKPSRKRQNRHLPDVCSSLGIKWCTPFEFNRRLGFRTAWKQKVKSA